MLNISVTGWLLSWEVYFVMTMKYIYGPVPSRRLGISLGVSPIPKKTCNYSCIYCQLGRTDHLTNTRKMFFPIEEILAEFEEILKRAVEFDVVTIVGEGEPTLYLGLGELISEIQKRTDKPVAVITNGALLYDLNVRMELYKVDIVLPSVDAYDNASFKKINRPHGTLDFDMVNDGLRTFSEEYQGQLWIGLMLIAGVNDDDTSLRKYSETLRKLNYNRLYINTPVRPPAESYVKAVDHKKMNHAIDILGGISIDLLVSLGFHSEITDHYEAILSIIKRHPMNQFEIEGFLNSRSCSDISTILNNLKKDSKVISINYKGYETYRLK
jgi:wyosine [tRNA(Phe)-imidazoG37] synthetase (radical SAM superfamily)